MMTGWVSQLSESRPWGDRGLRSWRQGDSQMGRLPVDMYIMYNVLAIYMQNKLQVMIILGFLDVIAF